MKCEIPCSMSVEGDNQLIDLEVLYMKKFLIHLQVELVNISFSS